MESLLHSEVIDEVAAAEGDERERVAELNLMAGKRAKNASAYASALKYLIAGAGLVAEDSWERRYDLAFAIELNRAECEFLIGDLAAAEARLSALSHRTGNLFTDVLVIGSGVAGAAGVAGVVDSARPFATRLRLAVRGSGHSHAR